MREKRTARGRFFFCAQSRLRLYFALHTKQVNTQRRVEARGGEHAEALDNAEICGGTSFMPIAPTSIMANAIAAHTP